MKEKKKLSVSKLSLRYETKVPLTEMPQIATSQQAYNLFSAHWSENINLLEEVYLILVNRNNKVLGISLLSVGSFTATFIDMRHVFSLALLARATGFFIAHNHPSGSKIPSGEDMKITQKLYDASKIMDIELIDHIILTPSGEYYSFSDEGILKSKDHTID